MMSTLRLPTRSSGIRRWLRSGATDVVLIVPSRHARNLSPLGMADGLPRWRRRITRSRDAALVRRWLLLGLALAIALELIAAATGASEHWLWLVLPAAITSVGILAGLLTSVGSAETALLLDRQLGLSERLTTALELAPLAAPTGSLSALVRVEADAAIDDSLGRSRTRDPSAVREWLSLLLCALLLAGALALGHTSGAHSRGPTAARLSAGAGVASAPATVAGTHSSTPAAPAQHAAQAHQSATPSHTAAGHSSATPRKSSTTAQSSAPSKSARTGAGAQSQHGAGASPRSNSHAPAGAGHGSTAQAPSSSSSHSPSPAGAARSGAQGAATTKSASATKAGAGLHTAGTAHAGTSTSAASTHSGASSAPAAGAVPSASSGAGAAPGRATTPGSHAVAKQKAATAATLPIQSGYTASHQPHSSSQTGGEGAPGGKTSQGQSESALSGEGAGVASFAFIPLSSSGVPYSDSELLLGYFGPFGSLAGLSW